MTGQLLNRQGSLSHSAGQAGRMPPQATPVAGSGRPHDPRQRVVRRQTVGAAGRTRECMRVGLRTACGIGRGWRGTNIFTCVGIIGTFGRKSQITMRMARQLLHRERGLADSAGQTFLIAAMRHNQELSYVSSYRSSLR